MYLLRSKCIHNHFHIFHVILGLNYVYILDGVGSSREAERCKGCGAPPIKRKDAHYQQPGRLRSNVQAALFSSLLPSGERDAASGGDICHRTLVLA